MKKFNLYAEESNHPAFFIITGDVAEKERLKKYLTVSNKSVAYQLIKTQENLRFWEGRQRQLETWEKDDPQTNSKVGFYKNQAAELKKEATVYYYEVIDGKLYIPAGFWHIVSNIEERLYKTDIEPKWTPDSRDYQIECIKSMIQYKRTSCTAPTGSGKARMITNVCLSMNAIGKRVFVVVPSDYLVGQLYSTINQFCDNVTMGGGGREPKLGSMVCVCTAQSALKYASSYDVLVVDEAHFSAANTWQEIHIECEFEYCYNFTATPFREDGKELGITAFAGPVSFERDITWMISNNYLLEPDIYSIELDTERFSDSTLATSAYKKTANSFKVLDYIRSQVLKAISKDRRLIVLFKTLEPANKLAKNLKKDGLELKVANGEFKGPLRDFMEGKTNVVIGTDKLLGTGVDIPSCDAIIIVTQHGSRSMTYQSVGRVMRLFEGKKKPIVIDITFNGFKQFRTGMEKRRKEFVNISKNITYIKG